jgi:hypothetical protein
MDFPAFTSEGAPGPREMFYVRVSAIREDGVYYTYPGDGAIPLRFHRAEGNERWLDIDRL